MTPEFARAVDPVFAHVLNLLERIERGESPAPDEERLRIRALLDRAEAAVGRSPEWQLTKYALVCWIDEVLLEAGWTGRDWWKNNALEFELFQTRLRNEQFYLKAREAGATPKRDALEVFYVCVILGFRGLYREVEAAAMLADARGLPPNLETWARQTALAIRLGQGRPRLTDSGETGQGAPAMRGQRLLIWCLLAGVLLAALDTIVAFLILTRS